jgi:hypothetical protein
MSGREALTLADLVTEIQHAGGDPATTTFVSLAGPVYNQGSHYSVDRVDGALVVDVAGDWDEFDDGADDLRMELVGVTHELAQAMKVVDAAKAWALTGNAGGFPHMRASVALLDAVHAHADALAEAITGVPAPRHRAAEVAKLVGAVSAWWAVEATRTSQTEHSSIWLEAEEEVRRALCIAAQDYETAEQLSPGEQADADRAAELAEDTARADHAERSER